ncbi:MAG: 5-methyltetrahydrofolate--homocysteine methyltransferase, partial [Muribaculaceae bacterium]|nr:5-methyltetrahydrofolate--homocysteine methyltransferase [Muribaculaceae bacterium]
DYSTLGIELTENGAMKPTASTSGLFLAAPEACYFEVGPLSDDDISDYARRRGLSPERVRQLLPRS